MTHSRLVLAWVMPVFFVFAMAQPQYHDRIDTPGGLLWHSIVHKILPAATTNGGGGATTILSSSSSSSSSPKTTTTPPPPSEPCVAPSIVLLEPTHGSIVEELQLEENFEKLVRVRIRAKIHVCEDDYGVRNQKNINNNNNNKKQQQKKPGVADAGFEFAASRIRSHVVQNGDDDNQLFVFDKWALMIDNVQPENWTISESMRDKTHEVSAFVDVEYGRHLIIAHLYDSENRSVEAAADVAHFTVQTPKWYQEMVRGPDITEILNVDVHDEPNAKLQRELQQRIERGQSRQVVYNNDNICEMAGISQERGRHVSQVTYTYRVKPFQRSLTSVPLRQMFPVFGAMFSQTLPVRQCRVAYSIGTDPVAVLVHLRTLDEWRLEFVPLLRSCGLTNFHVFISMDRQEAAITKMITNYLKRDLDNVNVIFRDPRGGHVGGLMDLVGHALYSGRRYHLYLFLHSTLLAREQQLVLGPILGSASQVRDVLDLFATRSDVGIIASKQGNRAIVGTGFTATTPGKGLENASKNLRLLPQKHAPYPAGTCFWARGNFIENLFTSITSEKWLAEMKTPEMMRDSVDHAPASSERILAYIMHASNYTMQLI